MAGDEVVITKAGSKPIVSTGFTAALVSGARRHPNPRGLSSGGSTRPAEVNRWLQEGANYDVGTQEKTPLAKTVRTCRQILAIEPALGTFVERVGGEPTNNAAERALRPAVIWRRTSFGAQSQAGSEFVARMLTVVTSLQAQQRDVLDFLTRPFRPHALGRSPLTYCLTPLQRMKPLWLRSPLNLYRKIVNI